jgi:hypothetical protein
MDTEIKAVLDETAKTFDAFKAAHSELEAEVKKIRPTK